MNSKSVPLPKQAQDLLERFEARDATIGIVGLGYVGLPLAMVLADGG